MSIIFKKIKKIFFSQPLIESIKDYTLDSKEIADISLLIINGNKNEVKEFYHELEKIKEQKLEKDFFELFKKIKKEKIINNIYKEINNQYLSYFSLYLYLFLFLELLPDKQEEILKFFFYDYKLTIPSNFGLPKNTTKNLEQIFKITLDNKGTSFYMLIIEILTKHNLLSYFFNNFDISKNVITMDIIKIKNSKFLNFLLDFKNLFLKTPNKFLDIYIKLGINNNLIKLKFSDKYADNFIQLLLSYMKNNNRNIIDNMLSKKYSSDIKQIFDLYSNSLKKNNKKYLNLLNKINLEIIKKRKNYLIKEIENLKQELKNTKDNIKKGQYLSNIKELKKELEEVKTTNLYNTDYYIFILLLLGIEKEKIFNYLRFVKKEELFDYYIYLNVENIEKEIKEVFNPKDKKMFKYYSYLIIKYLNKNKNKSYKEIFEVFEDRKIIISYIYSKLWKYIDKTKIFNELKKETECINCTKNAIKKYNLEKLIYYQKDFYDKLPEKNKSYIKKILKIN